MRTSDPGTALAAVVAVVGLFALACGGGDDPKGGASDPVGADPVAPATDVPVASGAADIPSPSTPWLLQAKSGLYDSDGTWLAPYGGQWDVRDVYAIDASADAFFLLSDEADEARIAERVAGGFAVRVVRADARVVRPFGALAFVRTASGAIELIDAKGAVLLTGMTPPANALSGKQEWPIYRPEYWWAEVPYGTLPVPVCDDAKKSCAWVDAQGALRWGDQWGRPTGFEYGRAMGWRDGDVWVVSPDGEPERVALPDKVSVFGMPSEHGALIVASVPTMEEPIRRAGVWTGTSLVEVEPKVLVEDVWCTDATTCFYRFHQGRAAVWAYSDQGLAGYLDESGAWAVGPTPCDAPILSGPFHDDRAFACEGDAYWMIDLQGNHVAGPYRSWGAEVLGLDPTPNTYPSGLFFSDGLAAVPVEGGWAYVDRSGAVVLPGPYAIARPFRRGLAVVETQGEVQYIDKTGTRRLQPPKP